ncbi:MAG TPA: PAS domain S-box protein [Gemmatimonadaceae bacterium]|nr:PAS domain S-box protein [Gemmatimonadaceae bacterium]
MIEANGKAAVSGTARRASRALVASRWLCTAGGLLGLAGLVGWLVNAPSLHTVLPGQAPMMPNAALALALAGSAGLLVSPTRPGRGKVLLVRIAGFIVLSIGIATLVEYVFRINLHVDQALIASKLGPNPGRASPLTALALASIGGALLIFDTRPTAKNRPSEWLLFAAGLISVVGLTGQILGTGSVYHLGGVPVVGMAVPTAVSLFLESSGLLLARPQAGVMSVTVADGPGGIVLRRIAVPSVVMPMLLGFLVARLFQEVNSDDYPIVVASIAGVITMSGLAVLVVTARLLTGTHDALQANRARARELISLASDGVFVSDLAGRFTEVNAAGCRMLGMAEDEIVGRTIADFIPPEEVERLAVTRARLLEGGTEMGEWLLRHKNGDYVPVEVSSNMLPGGRWQAIVRDISQRRAAEEESRRAKAKIDGIVSIAAEAIISIDESQRITIFNRSAERIFGWSASEAIGQPVEILIPERFRAVHRAHVHGFAADAGSARPMGNRGAAIFGLRKDGTEFVAEAAISKLRIGHELTFTVVVRDVTDERRHANYEKHLAAIGLLLTSSLDRGQLASSSANLLVGDFADICIVDILDGRDGNHRLAHTAVAHHDPAKAELVRALERVRLETRPSRFGADLLKSGRPVLLSHVTAAYIDAIARSDEHRRLMTDLAMTSIIWVPLHARGVLLGILAVALTNPRRRYDQADTDFCEEVGRRLALAIDNARLFETAKSAITARDEVLRIVAHDLRNPLGTILMRASLLKQDGRGRNGEGRESAEGIITAANRMNRLIRDLLDATRSEAGTLTLDRIALPAAAVVREAVEAQRALADKASLELRAEIPDELPQILGDRDRLLQIFENLIGNAAKFTKRGGRITVGATPREHEVLFWVSDTGEGMSADDLLHVFDRFWQGRTKHEGAGLGTVIVKALVEAHGGRVWVESTRGRGSTFYFTIPRETAVTAAAEAEDAAPTVG